MDRFAKLSNYLIPPLIGLTVGLVFEFIIRPFVFLVGMAIPWYVSIITGLGLTLIVAGYNTAISPRPPDEQHAPK